MVANRRPTRLDQPSPCRLRINMQDRETTNSADSLSGSLLPASSTGLVSTIPYNNTSSQMTTPLTMATKTAAEARSLALPDNAW